MASTVEKDAPPSEKPSEKTQEPPSEKPQEEAPKKVDIPDQGPGPQVELRRTADMVQHGVAKAKDDIQSSPDRTKYAIQELLQSIKVALTDYRGSINNQVPYFFAQCDMWAGVCLIAFAAGFIGGKSGFAAVTEGIFGSWATFMVLAFAGPVLVWIGNSQLQEETQNSPQIVFGVSVALGLFIGSALQKTQLKFLPPPVAALPVGLFGVATSMGNSQALLGDRRIFVPVMLVPAVFVFAMLGLSVEAVGSYAFYAFVLTLAGIVHVQMKTDAVNRGTVSSMPQEQWSTVVHFAVIDSLVYWLMAEKKE